MFYELFDVYKSGQNKCFFRVLKLNVLILDVVGKSETKD